MEIFEHYNSLGFMNPYSTIEFGKIRIHNNFNNAIQFKKSKNYIDSVAVSEMLNSNYFYGDRTIVKEINKTPWMAHLSASSDEWIFDELPAHGNMVMSLDECADKFLLLLKDEIMGYIQNKCTIGILLSGGMDSRIVAGVLYMLIKENSLDMDVIGLTWGVEESRDVQYAKQICSSLKWDWVHFPLTPEKVFENIEISAERGCEFSPIHLHAMPQVRNMQGIDCILAGSFGDSIGRAEFSGTHATGLSSIDNRVINRFKVIKSHVHTASQPFIHKDVQRYNDLFPRQELWQQFETQKQAHYMRRMLNPCMAYINEKIPLHQCFSDKKVFGFIWGLDASIRTDNIYRKLLDKMETSIANISWARTGKRYLINDDIADVQSKDYHSYGKWIRNDLRKHISDLLFNGSLDNLKVFNMMSVQQIEKINNKYSRSLKHTRIDEILIWLAALSVLIKKYDIHGISNENSISDLFNGLILSNSISFSYLKAKQWNL